MNKLVGIIIALALVLGVLLLIGAFFATGDSIGARICYFIIGSALIVSVFSSTVRHISLLAASLLGAIYFSLCYFSYSSITLFTYIVCLIIAIITAIYCIQEFLERHSIQFVFTSNTLHEDIPLENSEDHIVGDTLVDDCQFSIYADAVSSAAESSCSPASSPISPAEPIREYVVEYVFNQLRTPDLPAPEVNILDTYSRFGGINAELLTVDLMEGHDFEHWCASALRNMGFADVDVTCGSGDQGVDIIATKDGLRYAIQCKRYTSDLGNTPVQEVYAGKAMYRCHIAAVITNRYFTPSAKELASVNGVLLWDRDWLTQYIASQQDDKGAVLIEHSPPDSNTVSPIVEHDELLPLAVDIILETKQASVSMLQRKLKLGYARCARIIDEMENAGIVGPFQGSLPRCIRINKAEWELICKKLEFNK